jgi:hypothetical protein
MGRLMRGTMLVPGAAQGELLVTVEPLSFWGGYDPASGQVIDRRHPLAGVNAAGKVLAVPASKGSSTTTAVLVEALQAGTAPAGLITRQADTFLALGAIVADEVFGQAIPVLQLAPDDFDRLPKEGWAVIAPDGTLTLEERAA